MGPVRPLGNGAPPPPPMPVSIFLNIKRMIYELKFDFLPHFFCSFQGMVPPPPPLFQMPNAPPLQLNTLPHYLKPKKKFDSDGPMKRANWKAIIPQKLSEKAFWVKSHLYF